MWALWLAGCGGVTPVDSDLGDTAISDDAGEPPGLDCTPAETAWEGLPYCLATVGSLELKVFVPSDRAPDAPLAVYLHGDTANGYYEDWGFEALVPWAMANGVVFVAALAPNGCSWWRDEDECSWEIEDEDATNADALHEALLAVAAAYDARADGVRYVGYSGGSTFLTGHFLPLYGDVHPGVIVANCGGEEPIYDFAWDTSDARLRDRNPIVYTFGGADFMREYIEPAIVLYSDLGFSVTVDRHPGYGHCDADLDWDAMTLALWAAEPP
jgi:predicted esterase